MCWVMPPASPAATLVSRIASSSEVLPWSTWPMIVTTGGRVDELLVGVLELGLVDVVGGVDDLDALLEVLGQHLDRLVGERLGQRRHLTERHQVADDLRHGDAEVLGDVLDRRARVDPDQVGRLERPGIDRRHGVVVGPAPAPPASRRPSRRLHRRAARSPARGLRIDYDSPASAGSGATGPRLTLARVACRTASRTIGVARRSSLSARSPARSEAHRPAQPPPRCRCEAPSRRRRRGTRLCRCGDRRRTAALLSAECGERASSSTVEAAAFASTPAAWSLASRSRAGIPCSWLSRVRASLPFRYVDSTG